MAEKSARPISISATRILWARTPKQKRGPGILTIAGPRPQVVIFLTGYFETVLGRSLSATLMQAADEQ
jgi:hypothetical protein